MDHVHDCDSKLRFFFCDCTILRGRGVGLQLNLNLVYPADAARLSLREGPSRSYSSPSCHRVVEAEATFIYSPAASLTTTPHSTRIPSPSRNWFQSGSFPLDPVGIPTATLPLGFWTNRLAPSASTLNIAFSLQGCPYALFGCLNTTCTFSRGH